MLTNFGMKKDSTKVSSRKKFHDNTAKDSVTVTSSNTGQQRNNKNFEDFAKLTYFSSHEDDI